MMQQRINIQNIQKAQLRKTSNRQPNFTPKTTRKTKTKQKKISKRKEIMKIRAEISEKEMKETIVKVNKSCFLEKINKIDKPLFSQTRQ